MLDQSNIKSTSGARKTSKRVGRGNGSGKGTFSTRGCKGQNARSGGGVPDWFEGGQTPLFRRMPKLKGFSNSLFKKDYELVNVDDIEKLASIGLKDINKETLFENRLIRKKTSLLKVLGNGEIKATVTVRADKFSKEAKEKIEKAGGKTELY